MPVSGGRSAELTSAGPSGVGQAHARPSARRRRPVGNRDLRIASFREQDPHLHATGGGSYIGGNREPGRSSQAGRRRRCLGGVADDRAVMSALRSTWITFSKASVFRVSRPLSRPALRGTGCCRAHDSRGCSSLRENARRRGNTDSGRHRATTEISARLSGPDWSRCPGVEDGRPLTLRTPASR